VGTECPRYPRRMSATTLRDLLEAVSPAPSALRPWRRLLSGARDRLVAASGSVLPAVGGDFPVRADDLKESFAAFCEDARRSDHPEHLLRGGVGLEAAWGPVVAGRVVEAWRSGVATLQVAIVREMAPEPAAGFQLIALAQRQLLHDAGVVALVLRELAWARLADGKVTSPESDPALFRDEPHFQALVEQLPLAVLVVAADRLRYANPFAAGLLGYSQADALLGRTLGRLFPPGVGDAPLLDVRRVIRGGSDAAPWRWRWRRQGGGVVQVEVSALPLLLEGEAGCVLVARDVTGASADQARFLAADRRATMGMVATGVVHEIGNPLTVLSFALQSLRRELPGGPGAGAAEELLDEALDAGRRIRRIVRDVRVLARPDGAPEPVPMDRVIERAVHLAWPSIRDRARLVKDYASVPPVLAGEAGLTQVFLNLLDNAAHASSPDGDNEIRLTVREEDGGVVASVRDTGVGVAVAHQELVFEPFFTTRVDGAAGLGLTITASLVQGWGGRLDLVSQVGVGTTVRVWLPAAASSDEAEQSRSRGAAARHGHILLVEPDPETATAIERALREGHHVTVVASGAEARACIAADPLTIDAVVCAVPLPDDARLALVGWMQQERPDLGRRTVYLTSGAPSPVVDALRAASPNLFLAKPFDLDVLRQFLRALVDLGGSSAHR
jgi:PAS domain S-box-containing protein